MAGFIIATFRLLVYLLFFAITIGGAYFGWFYAWEHGYQPWMGGLIGLVAGFLNAVVVTGIMVILLDIQDSLRDIAKGAGAQGEQVHHHHHEVRDAEKSEASASGPYPEAPER